MSHGAQGKESAGDGPRRLMAWYSNGTTGERKTRIVMWETSSTRPRSTKTTVLAQKRTMNGRSSSSPLFRCTHQPFSDYNFIRQGKECVAAGPEPIPTDYCKSGTPGEKYMGSSGYRLIPGNTCNREQGLKKDDKVEKDCSQAQKPPGEVAHQTKFFKHQIAGNWYFPKAGVSPIFAHLCLPPTCNISIDRSNPTR
jgi:hypothetical protein